MDNNKEEDVSMPEETHIDRSPMERHTQTVLGVVATALLLWVGSTILTNSETLGRMDERMKGMETNVAELKVSVNQANSDRYTKHDAKVDKEQLLFMLDQMDKRVTKLEEK